MERNAESAKYDRNQGRRPSHSQGRTILPRKSPPAASTQSQTASTPYEREWEIDTKHNRTSSPSSASPQGRKRRREQVSIACMRCQKRRIKCDGARPSCESCMLRSHECVYGVPVGVSRNQNLKQQVESLTTQVEDLEQIIETLAQGNDFEASAALSRLRVGHSVSDIVHDTLHSATEEGASAARAFNAQVQAKDQSTSPTVPFDGPRGWLGTPVEDLLDHQLNDDSTASFILPLFDRNHWLYESISPPPRLRTNSISLISPLSPPLTSPSEDPFDASASSDSRSRPSFSPSTTDASPSVEGGSRNTISYITLSANAPETLRDASMNRAMDVPRWAVMPANFIEAHPSVSASMRNLWQEIEKLRTSGCSPQQVLGSHPSIAAMFDPGAFARAPLLSQWAARMTWSIKLTSTSFTAFAMMFLYWHLARWMLDSRPETYQDMPDWLRPTPTQLFVPHVELFDFLVWPRLREYAISTPALQRNLEWLMDMSVTLACSWTKSPQAALCQNPSIDDVDLTDEAKTCVFDLTNWTVAPVFRKHILNADAYVNIERTTTATRNPNKPSYSD